MLHLEPSVVALLGAGVLVAISGLAPQTYLADIEWETLLFFAGLFILVGALVKTGAIDHLADGLVDRHGRQPGPGHDAAALGLGGAVGHRRQHPLRRHHGAGRQQLVDDGPLAGQAGLWWALLLGADLGGNATAVGASANVVVTGIAKRNGHPISFWEFTKYGSVVAVVTLIIARPYLLLRY